MFILEDCILPIAKLQELLGLGVMVITKGPAGGSQLVGNRIEAKDNAIYLENANQYPFNNSDTTRVVNNTITSDGGYSLALRSSDLVNIYHNSVSGNSLREVVFIQNKSSILRVRVANNIFSSSVSVNGLDVYFGRFTKPDYWDYNNYYFSSPNFKNLFSNRNTGPNISDLVKLGWGLKHSKTVDPEWKGNDLRTYAFGLNNKGLNLSSRSAHVSKDIDSEKRPNLHDNAVDIGPNDYYLYYSKAPKSRSGDVGLGGLHVADFHDTSNLSPSGYGYYPKKIIRLARGSKNTLTIVKLPGQRAVQRKAWADWDNDGVFNDSNEVIFFDSASVDTNRTDSFYVPAIAAGSKIRMLVSATLPNGAQSPCGTRQVGEMEEYDILITRDLRPPFFTLLGKTIDTIDVYTSWNDPGFKSFDSLDGDVTNLVKTSGLVDTAKLGVYEITYTTLDHDGNGDEYTRTVVVADKSAPNIKLMGLGSMRLHLHDAFIDPGYSATDNYDRVLNVKVSGIIDTAKLGVYYVNYCASDSSGNGPSCVTRTVTVFDSIAPVITLIGAQQKRVEVYSAYLDSGYLVSDNDTYRVDTSGTFKNTDSLGTHSQIYTAVDLAGNKASVTRTINVVDTQSPTIKLKGSSIDTVYRWSAYIDSGVVVVDNYYDEKDLTFNKSGTFLNTQSAGVFTIIYGVSDPSNNVSKSITRNVVVVDPLDVERFSDSELSIYPNPSQGFVNLYFSNSKSGTNALRIYSTDGVLVYTQDGISSDGSTSVNLQRLPAGMYHLVIGNDRIFASQKFTITK